MNRLTLDVSNVSTDSAFCKTSAFKVLHHLEIIWKSTADTFDIQCINLISVQIPATTRTAGELYLDSLEACYNIYCKCVFHNFIYFPIIRFNYMYYYY